MSSAKREKANVPAAISNRRSLCVNIPGKTKQESSHAMPKMPHVSENITCISAQISPFELFESEMAKKGK